MYILAKLTASVHVHTFFTASHVFMQETIERARIAEAFMNAAGLSDNLEDLAKLVDQDEDEEGQVLIPS